MTRDDGAPSDRFLREREEAYVLWYTVTIPSGNSGVTKVKATSNMMEPIQQQHDDGWVGM